jgi:DNA-binding LytR/AlgR family response regulator
MNTDTLILIGGRKKICPNSILMLKANINYTQVYLEDGSLILSSTNLGILEKRLKDFDFFRTNRSTIINLQFVAEFEDKISVSRRKKTNFLKTFNQI